MTTTRTGYRIEGTTVGPRRYWEVIETAARGAVAIEAYCESGGYPEVETLELEASPAELRAIAAALVCIADAQDAEVDNGTE